MTNPVILLGTQSNGETLPVQVDEFGRLVAEGLQGSEGPPGPPGTPGADGGSFPLPPDPYEGALLGWLNGGLAWIGTPPVPIPEGVFGPITEWDPQSGALTVEGEIPAAIGTGVYVYQCDAAGELYSEGWNVSDEWSYNTTGSPFDPNYSFANVFNGSVFHTDGTAFAPASDIYSCFPDVAVTDIAQFIILNPSSPPDRGCRLNGSLWLPESDSYTGVVTATAAELGGRLTGIELINAGSTGPYLTAIRVDGKLLVNSDLSMNMRVQQVVGNVLVGTANHTSQVFTPGQYLKTTNQRVAPWVLRGGQPATGMLQGP